MLIYTLYKTFIEDGDGELVEYFAFVFYGLLSIPLDIILSPLEIIAFIIWKIKER